MTTRLATPQKGDCPVQFTGIVVTFNEARRLHDCLNSLTFCGQLILVDLGSTDNSVEIAHEFGANIVHHSHVPIVEQAREVAADYAIHDWIILADPDEMIPTALVAEIVAAIKEHSRAGILSLPYRYYFRGEPIDCTFWGRACRSNPRVIHRRRVDFPSRVHGVFRLHLGYEKIEIPESTRNSVQHYWADTYRQLFAKHWRYIKHQGQALYETGERFGWRCTLRTTRDTLKQNLFEYEGIRGGWTGIFLSLFYTWYVFMSRLSLRRYQRSIACESSCERGPQPSGTDRPPGEQYG